MYSKIKSAYRKYNATRGTGILGTTGAIMGTVAGVALPLYIGWEIGDYIKDALEFGFIVGAATKAIGAIGLTTLVGGVTVPVGLFGGGFVGAIVGNISGRAKESLEKKLSRR